VHEEVHDLSHPLGIIDAMDDELEQHWTPEGIEAWNRSMAEIERLSAGAIEGLRTGQPAAESPAVDTPG
jgi:hypothetical protein